MRSFLDRYGIGTLEAFAFSAGILAAGALRFMLTVSGVANSVTRYASMTVVILAGTIYFAMRLKGWRSRMVASYILLLPYMGVELAALGYTWATGEATIFHAAEYSFGTGIATHFWGHLAGGLTWEPWSTFLVMSLLAWLRSLFVRTPQ